MLTRIDMFAGMGARRFFKTLLHEINADDLLNLASQCAYSLIFSLFPFLMLVIAISAHVLPKKGDGATPALPPEIEQEIPGEVRQLLDARLTEAQQAGNAGTITFAIILTLWSASTGSTMLISAVNKAHDVVEKRPAWKRYGMGILLTLAGLVLVLVPALWTVLGGLIGHILARIGLPGAAEVVSWLRWPALIAGALTWMMLLYRIAPETSKRWRPFTPGAIFSMIALFVANLGLGLYFGFSAKSQTVTYGALSGFIALLLYLYVISVILLVGAEINAVLEQARKGSRPEEPSPARATAPARARPAGRLVESTP